MTAIDVLANIYSTSMLNANCQYCLVKANKLPYKIDGTLARPNQPSDFVSLATLVECENLEEYAGLGVSIQASKLCAIDVDHCFERPLDISSIDKRGKDILEMFEGKAYCEFSFSGTGLRIFFKAPIVENYSETYYIKNSKNEIEYYQYTGNARYVTITGNTISDNFSNISDTFLLQFLDKYMKKEIRKSNVKVVDNDNRDIEELLVITKRLYLKNIHFQDLWFGKAPGSHSNESELDYELLVYLYENITQDVDKIRQLFEMSYYFSTKDFYHKTKWSRDNYRYFKFQYNEIRKRHM